MYLSVMIKTSNYEDRKKKVIFSKLSMQELSYHKMITIMYCNCPSNEKIWSYNPLVCLQMGWRSVQSLSSLIWVCFVPAMLMLIKLGFSSPMPELMSQQTTYLPLFFFSHNHVSYIGTLQETGATMWTIVTQQLTSPCEQTVQTLIRLIRSALLTMAAANE